MDNTDSLKQFSIKRIISSGLDENSFGKIKMTSSMNEEKGFLFKANGQDGKIESIESGEWIFSGTETDDDGKVWLCGEMFDNAMTVSETLEKYELAKKSNDGREKARLEKKIVFIEKVLTQAIDSKTSIGGTGGGGIFISENDDAAIFLPSGIFDLCETNKHGQDSREYSEKQGFYIYKGLKETDQTMFTRGVIAYKALTGQFPYTAQNLSDRQTDIFDRKFTPTAYTINGIETELSDAIDAALSLPLKFEPIPGERRYKNDKADFVRNELLKLASSFKISSFQAEIAKNEREKELTESEFKARTEKFIRNRDRKVGLSRLYRRNKTRIFVTAAVVLAALWMFKGYQDTNGLLATTTGLDSEKAAATFYTQMHRADIPNIQEIAKGKGMKDFVNIITGFYVMGKEREGYDAKNRTVPPEEWFFNNTSPNLWMYGITHLKIDGKDYDSEFDFPRRNEKRKPITEENGKALSKGDETKRKAEYFFIHTDSSKINIEKIEEEVELVWNGKRWVVEELAPVGKSKAETVKLKDLSEKYEKLVEENAGSARKAIDELRKEYPWIPSESDLSRGAGKLFKKYSLKRAGDFLSGL